MTQYRNPVSDQSVSWVASEGDDRYAMVNDHPSTNDSVYNWAPDGSELTDIFGFSSLSVPFGVTINSVKVHFRAKNNLDNKLNGAIQVGGTIYVIEKAITADWANYECVWETNPATVSAWTVDQVNGVGSDVLQYFGYRGNGADEYYKYVSKVYMEVVYIDIPGLFYGNIF